MPTCLLLPPVEYLVVFAGPLPFATADLPRTPDTLSTGVMRTLFAMPRSGQPGVLQFDGMNVTEFLDEWELLCEDYGLTPEQMVS